MSNNSTTNEQVSFIQRHEPLVKDGEYTITLTQNASLLGTESNGQPSDLSESVSKTIYVAGERFSIGAKNIFNCFPPPNNTGDYSNVLPHIALTRSTLPWERNADSNDATVPWMWLFIYDDNDIAAGNVIKPARVALSSVFEIETSTNTSTASETIPMTPEPGDESAENTLADTPVSVVQIDLDWLNSNSIVPANSDLVLLTCVRKNQINGTDAEHAICIANRMPKQGVRSYACLLSLENRLTELNAQRAYHSQGVSSNNFTSFICLHEWSFSCLNDQCYQLTAEGFSKLSTLALPSQLAAALDNVSLQGLFTDTASFTSAFTSALGTPLPSGFTDNEDVIINCFEVPNHTFNGLLQKVSSASFGMAPIDNSQNAKGTATVNQYLSTGAIALHHHLKDGGKTISWYHGPFRPSTAQSAESLPAPVLSSDQLLRFDSGLNMLDVSYAAAWELGRMMTLKNKSVAMDLYTWKRQQTWNANQAASSYLQAFKPNSDGVGVTKEQNSIQSWCNDLLQLANIPFNYLVPDERLLPNESIRFFVLDNLWLNSLLDGALSIGRVSASDTASDSDTLTTFGVPFSKTYSGFLLRSEVVSGWPYLMVTAKGINKNTPNQVARTLCGPGLLLFLFDDEIKSADIHLKPESLHFGFDVSYSSDAPDTPVYSKKVHFQFSQSSSDPNELTVAQITSSTPSVPVIWKNPPVSGNPLYKIVDIGKLNSSIQTASGTSSAISFTSAQFALEMIEGVPHITFTCEPAETSGSAANSVQPKTGIRASDPASLLDALLGMPDLNGGDTEAPHRDETMYLGEDGPTHKRPLLGSAGPRPEAMSEGLKDEGEMLRNHPRTGEGSSRGEEIEDLNGNGPVHKEPLLGSAEAMAINMKPGDESPQKKSAGRTSPDDDKDNSRPDNKPVPSESEPVTDPVEEQLHDLKDDNRKNAPKTAARNHDYPNQNRSQPEISRPENPINKKLLPGMSSLAARKNLVTITLLILGVSFVIWIVSYMMDERKPEPLIFHFEGVKQLAEMEFVKQTYEEVIPVATKEGKLEFLLSVPASIEGKMDMTKLSYETGSDNTVKVMLPDVIISDVMIDLDSARDYFNRRSSVDIFLSGGGRDYSEAYTQIVDAISQAKKGVLADAVKNDIVSETKREARTYMINLAASIGYRIEFIEADRSTQLEEDLKGRLGNKVYNEIKHKVENRSKPLEGVIDKIVGKNRYRDSKTSDNDESN